MPQIQYFIKSKTHTIYVKLYRGLSLSFTVVQIPAASTNSRPMANTTPQEHLGNLRTEATRLIHGSISTNTHKAYQGTLTNFKKMFEQLWVSIGFFPIPIDHLLNFIAHLSISGTAYRTAALYISALSYIHKLRGIQDNAQSFIVKKKPCRVSI